eukprot:Pgem_evm1s18037
MKQNLQIAPNEPKLNIELFLYDIQFMITPRHFHLVLELYEQCFAIDIRDDDKN